MPARRLRAATPSLGLPDSHDPPLDHATHPNHRRKHGSAYDPPVLILLPPSEGKAAPAPRQAARPRRPRLPVPDRRPRAGPRRAGRAVRGRPGPRRQDPRPRRAPSSTWSRRNARLRTAPDRPRRPGLHRRPLRRPRRRLALVGRQAPRAAPGSRSPQSLFGLVRPGDRIPAYRLSGDATLPGLGPVAGLWRETPRPGGRRRRVGDGLLVDLRSTHVRRVLAAAGRARAAGGDGPGAARDRRQAQGRQPLQQGHQGPAGPRPARGRRATRAPRPRWPTCCATSAGRSRRATPGRTGTQLDVVVSEV